MNNSTAQSVRNSASRQKSDSRRARMYAPGISVIIPTYKGRSRLPALIDALSAQSLPHDLFELVFVVNGPEDTSAEYLAGMRKEHADLNIRIARSRKCGAGVARNIGLAAATREFVTFVDDDDLIGEHFLRELFRASNLRGIAVSPMCDRPEKTREYRESLLSQRIQALAGKKTPITSEPWLLGFNACKSIPTVMANSLRYDESLTSGEDVAYFAGLLNYPGLTIHALKDNGRNRYIRNIREESVSRQEKSFQFNVADRLACISSIQKHELTGSAEVAQRSLCASQFGFIQTFWDAHPEEHEAIREAIAAANVNWMPWAQLNSGMASRLVFSYCFPPYADPSAAVMAKLVLQQTEYVDVISADMSRVRTLDESLLGLVNRWIDHHVQIATPASFANWSLILEFAEAAAKEAEKLTRARQTAYESIYSRVMWPGSHLAAYLYKQAHPGIPWTAEFSDPMRVDASAQRRECPLGSDSLTTRLLKQSSVGNPETEVESGFDLIETLTLEHADELVFTNENQLGVVLGAYSHNFADRIRQKCVVRPHPVPAADMYSALPPAVELPEDSVNIGYFGSFYPNRGLGEVFQTVQRMGNALAGTLHFHIFTSNVEQVCAHVPEAMNAKVTVSQALTYLSFLSTSTKFDVLFVGDAETEGTFTKNPFLPSKYSDYLGSGAKIWAHVEPGSPLSREDVDFRSSIGNEKEIQLVVEELASHVDRKGADHGAS